MEFLEMLPAFMPALLVSLGVTKAVKNGYERLLVAATGAYAKMPVRVTQGIAVLIVPLLSVIAGQEPDMSLVTEDAFGGLLATVGVWILGLVKPKREVVTA